MIKESERERKKKEAIYSQYFVLHSQAAADFWRINQSNMIRDE